MIKRTNFYGTEYVKRMIADCQSAGGEVYELVPSACGYGKLALLFGPKKMLLIEPVEEGQIGQISYAYSVTHYHSIPKKYQADIRRLTKKNKKEEQTRFSKNKTTN